MEQENKKKKYTGANSFYLLIGFVLGITIITIFGIYRNTGESTRAKDPIIYKNESMINPVELPEIPDKLNFAGERVPLENFEVKERIQREFLVNTYWYSSTILGMQRANRWFPVIDPILKRYNIPDDFKYIPVIESDLTNAISPAGAVGFWQITEAVAKKYGLEVNNEVDERYNVEKSTEAACKYFLDAYNKYKSWTLAAASFNMGMNGMDRQLERQKAHNYYNLVLSDETSRYIPRVIAIKQIFTHPKEYGFDLTESELYPPLKTYNITIDSSVSNWADFAIGRGINYKILKYYNPWLRDTFLTNLQNKVYKIKMPAKGSIVIIKDN